MVLTEPTEITPLEDHTRENKWASHPIWANYATQLDESPLAYFLPTHFEALRILTAVAPPYAEAWTQSGSLCLYFVGTVPEDRPFGPFWDPQCEEHYISKKAQFPSDAYRFFTFGRAVQQDLDTQDRDDQWERAYKASKEYTATHRKYARKIGKLTDIDMECHDLSKTRLLDAAQAFLFHFGDDRTKAGPYDKELVSLAWEAMDAGHLELENHHLEYQGHPPSTPSRWLWIT